MRILVTGGAGYLGSVLVRQLLACEPKSITVVDNFRHGIPSLLPYCSEPNVEIVRADVRDVQTMSKLYERADVIFPLAAIVGAPACDEDRDLAHDTNYMPMQMLRQCDRIIIYPNTNSGYGTGGDAPLTEEDLFHPVSYYGQTKVWAEEELLGSCDYAVSLRFATLFGASPRMRLDLMVNDFVYRAVKDHAIALFSPQARRNYLHVLDAANALIHAWNNIEQMKGQVYNVGLSRANLTKGELCQKINEHVPLHVFIGPGHDPDRRDYLISNIKMESTGWRAQYDLDNGIEELIQCYTMPFENNWRNY